MTEIDLHSFVDAGLFNNNPDHNIPKLCRKYFTSKKTLQTYCTVRYHKPSMIKDDYLSVGLMRSVVYNNSNKQVLSFSPQKSIDHTSESFGDWNNDSIQAEEYVDGTMINVFWDELIGESGDWQITSRSCVEANVGFYLHTGSKTFRYMFLDACNTVSLEFDYLKKKHDDGSRLCYSFILQHPDNRIVVPYHKPNLVLVKIYKINQQSDKLTVIPYEDSSLKSLLQEKTSVQFPEVYKTNVKSEDIQGLIDTYASKNTPYNVQGLVFSNLTNNNRAKIRNPIYEEVRRLKGNQPKIQYRYLTLRQQNKVSEYLKMFPEDGKAFSTFRDQLHNFTKGLYQNYVNCYIKKQRPLKEFPYQFRTHMFLLHRKYLDELVDSKKSINMSIVIEYVNSLHPSKQMFAINYHMRKRTMDAIDVSVTE